MKPISRFGMPGKTEEFVNAFWRHIWRVGFVLLVAIAILFSTTRLAALADFVVLDSQNKFLSKFFTKPVVKEVVVVGIDEETLKHYPEPLALWHPHFARFLEAMALARPTVVGFDVVFPDRSYDRLVH